MIAALVFLMGVTIRHYFNTKHARAGNPTWTWIATAILFVVAMWLSTIPPHEVSEEESAGFSKQQQIFASAAGFESVRDTVQGRCSMCHAAEPSWDGIIAPPKGVKLETEAQIAAHAYQIYIFSGGVSCHAPWQFNRHFQRRATANCSMVQDCKCGATDARRDTLESK